MAFSAPFWSPAEASAILFDWDGVIAETKLDFSGIRKKYYGGRRAMLLEDAVTLPDNIRENLMRDLEDIEMKGAYESVPVPGISGILEWVDEKKIPWAVVSRNCRKSIIAAADCTGIRLPEIVRSRDDGDCVKPDPRALFETCDALGVPASQTVFIGDFIYDMMGARRAGMRGVLVRKSVEPDWGPWLECAYTSMADLCSELLSPSEMVPWEYKDVVKKHGRDFLARNHKLALRVPNDAKPDIPSWIVSACSMGVGTLIAPTGKLEPDMWRRNMSFDPAYMGTSIENVLRGFVSVRFPFVSVAPGESRKGLDAPKDANSIEKFLLDR